MAARRQALRLAACALEQQLNGDTGDHVGPQLPCPCGGSAQYHGRHSKTFESVLGPLHLQRAYYHCEQCQSGFCPRDRALGLVSFSLTPGVLRMTASAAALLSFQESSGLLQELAGVEVSVKQVERAAETLGAEITVDEHRQVEKIGEVAPTMYLGMDGTGVPMRTQEIAGRAGKQAAIARQQIAVGRKFRQQVDDYWDACEEWADAQLELPSGAASGEAQKGGSKRTSKAKSSRKSKRS